MGTKIAGMSTGPQKQLRELQHESAQRVMRMTPEQVLQARIVEETTKTELATKAHRQDLVDVGAALGLKVDDLAKLNMDQLRAAVLAKAKKK